MLISKNSNNNNNKYFGAILNYLSRMRSLGPRNGHIALYLQEPNVDWEGAYLVGKDPTCYLPGQTEDNEACFNWKFLKFVSSINH